MIYSVAIHWLINARASANTHLLKKTSKGKGQQKEKKRQTETTKKGEKKTNATSTESNCTDRRSARNPNSDK